MDSDKIFSEGITFTPPHANAPKFVIGKISVSVEQFITFLNDYKNDKGWVNLDLKHSQKGKYYFELNTWKKGDPTSAPKPAQVEYGEASIFETKEVEDINPDDIPF